LKLAILCLRWDVQNESIITSVTNIAEEKILCYHEPFKCCTQWNKKCFCQSHHERIMKLWIFFNTFPMEKPFNYKPLKFTCWHKAGQVSCPNASSIITMILCTKIIVNIKHGFPSRCCCLFKFLVELYHLHNFGKCKYQ